MKLLGERPTTKIFLTMIASGIIHSFSGHSECPLMIAFAVTPVVAA
jgi:hypothetical protein